MDRSPFDALTRLLAAVPSRRTTLGALLGGAVASALPAGPEGAVARKRKKTRCRKLLRRCRPGKAPRCCKGSVCGTSQIAGSFCCTPKNRACRFSLERDECCPGFACSETTERCIPLE